MDAYVSEMDYRLNASDAAPHFFPSSDTVYCESSDETCAACRGSATFANAMTATMDTTAFCLGEDGCVCVAFCESPYYDQLVGTERCNTTSSTAAASTVLGVSIRVIALVSALCISLPVVVIVCFGQRGIINDACLFVAPLHVANAGCLTWFGQRNAALGSARSHGGIVHRKAVAHCFNWTVGRSSARGSSSRSSARSRVARMSTTRRAIRWPTRRSRRWRSR